MARAEEQHRVRVSVIIPVYNTGEYLRPGLQSLADQDLPAEEFEVVAVDDGSTDGSGALLDDWAAEHPNLTVVHQPNSGWPGQPRNRGIDLSVGRYVFFMDGDDYLAPHALRDMADFADEHGSDVVVVKTQGVNGRYSSNRPWRATVADSDLFDVFRTLAPQKLFRRSFLREHDLRFPEEKVRLEDGMFLAHAYLRAARVSTLADDVYYFQTQRDGGANISAGVLDPVGYTQSIRVIGTTVRELCRDTDLADRIVLDLYRRKGLKVFAPDRFLGYSEARRAAWVESVADLAGDLVPPRLEADLEEPFRTRSRLARSRDVDAMVALCQGQSPEGPVVEPSRGRAALNRLGRRGARPIATDPLVHLHVRAEGAERTDEGLVLTGRARLRGRSPVHLSLVVALRPRSDPGTTALDVAADTGRLDDQGTQSWRAVLTRRELAELPDGAYEVLLRDDRGELEAVVDATGVDKPPPVRFPRLGRVLRSSITPRGRLVLRLRALDED